MGGELRHVVLLLWVCDWPCEKGASPSSTAAATTSSSSRSRRQQPPSWRWRAGTWLLRSHGTCTARLLLLQRRLQPLLLWRPSDSSSDPSSTASSGGWSSVAVAAAATTIISKFAGCGGANGGQGKLFLRKCRT
ncbi:hypothetical protein VaNZ11_002118, partial [Volvox africanus]